jgi:GT2 family glycosyltransferase
MPLGTAAARNRGVRDIEGEIILFIDSDCVPKPDVLHELAFAAERYPEDQAFQLRLVSGEENRVLRLEGLRLHGIQQVTRLSDGEHVGFANTSGFSVRRAWLGGEPPFDSGHVRGQDTGLLMRLAADGKPPRHLPSACVEHRPNLSTWKFVKKHFAIGYGAGQARSDLRRSNVEILSNEERGSMFREIHQEARARRYGPFLFLVFLACYANERIGRIAYDFVGLKRGRVPIGKIGIDPIRLPDLLAQVLQAAERGRRFLVTGVSKQTIAEAASSSEYADLLMQSDVLYAADHSVRSKLWWKRFRRTHTIEAPRLAAALQEESSRRGIRFSRLDLDAAESDADSQRVIDEDPNLVLVSGSPPMQEQVAHRLTAVLPRAVIWCIGR